MVSFLRAQVEKRTNSMLTFFAAIATIVIVTAALWLSRSRPEGRTPGSTEYRSASMFVASTANKWTWFSSSAKKSVCEQVFDFCNGVLPLLCNRFWVGKHTPTCYPGRDHSICWLAHLIDVDLSLQTANDCLILLPEVFENSTAAL